MVHRDIKPANVMIRKTGGVTVLIDFGLADSDDYVVDKGVLSNRKLPSSAWYRTARFMPK